VTRQWHFHLPVSHAHSALSALVQLLRDQSIQLAGLRVVADEAGHRVAMDLSATDDALGTAQATCDGWAEEGALQIKSVSNMPTVKTSMAACRALEVPHAVWTLVMPRDAAADSAALWADILEHCVSLGQIMTHVHCLTQDAPQGDGPQVTAYEMWSAGTAVNPALIKAVLLALADRYGVDLMVQNSQQLMTQGGLAVFDMDSTLIQTEVIDELAMRAGIGEQVQAITASAMQGHIDFQQSFRQRMALLEGLSVDVLDDIAAQLPIMPGAQRLFRQLRAMGYKTAILSGGFTYFAEQVQRLLGIDWVYANDLLAENGKLTGQVGDDIVDGEKKAALLQQLANKLDLTVARTIAVGDGANDVPMLSIAGLGVAFHAKPKVRAAAQHSLSVGGLDTLLYALGQTDDEINGAVR
jgi:phosphoserine phosphatase